VDTLLTLSWDDGPEQDRRAAEVMSKYGLSATFYAPCTNSEGRAVLSPTDMKELSSEFEIGGHTLEHRYLDSLSPEEIIRQVSDGKRELEQILGNEIQGFCYPGGRHNAAIRQAVQNAGYGYARTIEMFRTDLGSNVFEIPTSLQFYPHRFLPLIRNFLKHGSWQKRLRNFVSHHTSSRFPSNIERFADHQAGGAAYIHIWGHTWEIEEYGLWGEFEELCRRLAETFPADQRVGNAELAQHFKDTKS